MIAHFFDWLDPQARTLDRYRKIVDSINKFAPDIAALSAEELAQKTAEFRGRLADGASLETLLPEVYAVVREAAHRSIGLRHFDVQLMAGIAFHEGNVAEQRTGEGKTLSATTALYLNALPQKGVHLVTVNDYLAQVGAGWMGPLYHALGVSVAVIGNDISYLYDPDFTGEKRGDERLEHFRPVTRQEAYAADITYGTNNEFGFDYLRDNMAQRLEDQVQRGHYFAIVDEADSILIDEARTPLIISAPDTEPTAKYQQFAQLVRQLAPKTDYQIDEKMKTAVLTDLGVKRLERMLNITNLYEEGFDVIHHVEQALKALAVYQRDVDYVVRDQEVIIVDEHTGRLMIGRRYSDGLHQAIEAKEGVPVQQESRTLATISLQNYFRLYQKLAGMSGTSATEAEEFKSIYGMDVIVVPTHRPLQRVDHSDIVFKTMRAKYSALAHEVETVHAEGRPILIGTRSIEQNQVIADLLNRKKITHQILNAKNHEKEAFIIAAAGKKGAITVATNIAGRGVDIVLGGAQPEKRDYDNDQDYQTALQQWQKQHDEVVALGGLHIIGTTRHEARRIDNQLRGRAGRQGDPGSSRFYVSLEDEIMRLFGGEQIQKILDVMRVEENLPIEHPLIGKAITQAQIKVEGFFFDQRKNLVQYDDVMNRQREVIYGRRYNILASMSSKEKADESNNLGLRQRFSETFRTHFAAFMAAREAQGWSEVELQNLTNELGSIIPFDNESLQRIAAELTKLSRPDDQLNLLEKIWDDTYALRQKTLGEPVLRDIEKYVMLSSLDEQWMNHLDDMTHLRDSIWLRGSKEQALAEYKKEAFRLFEAMITRIELEAIRRLFRIHVHPTPAALPREMQLSGPSEQNGALPGPEPISRAGQVGVMTPDGSPEQNLAAALAGVERKAWHDLQVQAGHAGTSAHHHPHKHPKKSKHKKKRRGGSYL